MSDVTMDQRSAVARSGLGWTRLVGVVKAAGSRINSGADGYTSLARDLIKSSWIYALASLAVPLISLVLSPFLAHTLSRSEFGALVVLMTLIAFMAGLTQLSLGSAFFRAYNYDYESQRDRLSVVSTEVILLLLISIPTFTALLVAAPWVSEVVLGNASYSGLLRLAAAVVLLQNLTVPGFAWLRAEHRAAMYATLSISNLLVNLFGTLILLGVFHLALSGALLATGAGYAVVALATLPIVVRRAGLRPRRDIAWNLVAFGAPLTVGQIAFWVLQLSDRVLLGHFGSLAQAATYAVAYSLGGLLSIVIISPFQLAWPAVLYAIAKRDDAAQVFRRVFRWYGSVLLAATYALSLVGLSLLTILYPPAYASASPIVPVIALATMTFGLTQVVGVGFSIRRKNSLAVGLFGVAALVNVALNVALIPSYGAIGAAFATLAAYIVLAVSYYVVNQRIYPMPLEIGRFVVGALIGLLTFIVCYVLADHVSGPWRWLILIVGLAVFASWLVVRERDTRQLARRAGRWLGALRGGWVLRPRHVAAQHDRVERRRESSVCMHVLGAARNDARVLREATALAHAGIAVSIVDVEADATRPCEEDVNGIHITHIFMPSWFVPTRFKPWFLVKLLHMLAKRTSALARLKLDAYHAHDDTSLFACFLVAMLRRKPLIFDAHELPEIGLHAQRRGYRRILRALSLQVARAIVPRCAGVITVSPPIVCELQRRFGGPVPALVRNIPPYQVPVPSQRLHERLRLRPHTRIALYQGLLEEDRSLETLVHAARFLAPDIAIVMLGDGPRRPHLEALIAQEEVGDRVYLLPAVPNSELLAWTAAADLGLIVYASPLRNVQLCLPNKLFEYLMAGLPVLTAPLEAIVEVAQTYDVGAVVHSVEPQAVGQAISALLADEAALSRMRRNALAACARELRWEVEQERLIALYRGALGVQHATLATE